MASGYISKKAGELCELPVECVFCVTGRKYKLTSKDFEGKDIVTYDEIGKKFIGKASYPKSLKSNDFVYVMSKSEQHELLLIGLKTYSSVFAPATSGKKEGIKTGNKMRERFNLDVVSVRLEKDTEFISDKAIMCPCDAVALVGDYLRELDRETVMAIYLSTKGKPIGCHIVSIGSLNHSMVHPREVFKAAVLSNAASIIVMHNHPDEVLEPSEADMEVTERLSKCGEVMGIPVLDHIIVGKNSDSYYSLMEKKAMSISEMHYEVGEQEFGYLWICEDSSVDGVYSFYKTVNDAQTAYLKAVDDAVNTCVSYGIAKFNDNKLEPVKVKGSFNL